MEGGLEGKEEEERSEGVMEGTEKAYGSKYDQNTLYACTKI